MCGSKVAGNVESLAGKKESLWIVSFATEAGGWRGMGKESGRFWRLG